jgi:hypothetical protein
MRVPRNPVGSIAEQESKQAHHTTTGTAKAQAICLTLEDGVDLWPMPLIRRGTAFPSPSAADHAEEPVEEPLEIG